MEAKQRNLDLSSELITGEERCLVLYTIKNSVYPAFINFLLFPRNSCVLSPLSDNFSMIQTFFFLEISIFKTFCRRVLHPIIILPTFPSILGGGYKRFDLTAEASTVLG